MVYSAGFSERAERQRIFRLTVPFFGKVLPAGFFKKTSAHAPGIERIHNLVGGIFKPAWSLYALSIASMLKSPTGRGGRTTVRRPVGWSTHRTPRWFAA